MEPVQATQLGLHRTQGALPLGDVTADRSHPACPSVRWSSGGCCSVPPTDVPAPRSPTAMGAVATWSAITISSIPCAASPLVDTPPTSAVPCRPRPQLVILFVLVARHGRAWLGEARRGRDNDSAATAGPFARIAAAKSWCWQPLIGRPSCFCCPAPMSGSSSGE